jgi:hypothetical protein
MNNDLYVYYRVSSERGQELQVRVLAMQKDLAAEYGIATALKRRPEEKDGRYTWMEVYLAAPQGFTDVLERAVEQARLADIIEGPRHTEYFMDCSTCA